MTLEKVYTSQISYLFIPLSISHMDTSVIIASEAFSNSDRGHRCLEYPQLKEAHVAFLLFSIWKWVQVPR